MKVHMRMRPEHWDPTPNLTLCKRPIRVDWWEAVNFVEYSPADVLAVTCQNCLRQLDDHEGKGEYRGLWKRTIDDSLASYPQ